MAKLKEDQKCSCAIGSLWLRSLNSLLLFNLESGRNKVVYNEFQCTYNQCLFCIAIRCNPSSYTRFLSCSTKLSTTRPSLRFHMTLLGTSRSCWLSQMNYMRGKYSPLITSWPSCSRRGRLTKTRRRFEPPSHRLKCTRYKSAKGGRWKGS